jgi:hypothetical protein
MKINLRIEFVTGESKEVSCVAPDLVKFEEKYDMSIAVLETQMRFTHLMYLAWASESRRKETIKEFDAWCEDVSAVEASEIDPK